MGQDDDERQSSFGLWRYAYEYLRAAKVLDDNDPNPWVASSVTYQCACQGIELAFKAYLRAIGMDTATLKRIGHSLEACMDAAFSKGLAVETFRDGAQAIRMIDQYYKAQEFRYIKTGTKEYPGIGELLQCGGALLHGIADSIAIEIKNPDLAHRMKVDVSTTFGTL